MSSNFTMDMLSKYAAFTGRVSVHIDLIEKAAERWDIESVLCGVERIRKIEKEFEQEKLELQLQASIAEDCHDRHCDPNDFFDGGIPAPGM